MTTTIITDFNLEPNADQLIKALRISDKQKRRDEFLNLLEEATSLGAPKALFRKVTIEEKAADYVVVGGIKLGSRILRVNLDSADVAYAALITCGLELEKWALSKSDLLKSYWAQSIQEHLLNLAVSDTQKRLAELHNAQNTSLMTPGSLKDWPISEQQNLFKLYDQAHESIGVTLTDSLAMKPLLTLSCLVFESEKTFKSCQLCSKENCIGRRAPYEEHLFEKYGISPGVSNQHV